MVKGKLKNELHNLQVNDVDAQNPARDAGFRIF